MKLPLGLFTALGSKGYDLYSQLYKGAKVAVGLKADSATQMDLGPSYKNSAGASPHQVAEIRVFNFRTKCTLRLKNISQAKASNIKILNASDVFSTINQPEGLLNLGPNEWVDMDCWFVSNQVHITEAEKQDYNFVHPDKVGKQLMISYENESGTLFYTVYTLTAAGGSVDYSLTNPLEG